MSLPFGSVGLSSVDSLPSLWHNSYLYRRFQTVQYLGLFGARLRYVEWEWFTCISIHQNMSKAIVIMIFLFFAMQHRTAQHHTISHLTIPQEHNIYLGQFILIKTPKRKFPGQGKVKDWSMPMAWKIFCELMLRNLNPLSITYNYCLQHKPVFDWSSRLTMCFE